jgi:hypothetical protein
MPAVAYNPAQRVEYSILRNVKPTGPSLGFYKGREIPESIVDDLGRHLVYAGIAPRKWDGQLDGDALAPGEFIVRPGLIYRMESIRPSWLDSWFHAA